MKMLELSCAETERSCLMPLMVLISFSSGRVIRFSMSTGELPA